MYSQLQKYAGKSWDSGAALSVSAARRLQGLQGRDTEETRAAAPTLARVHLELTIHEKKNKVFFSSTALVSYRWAKISYWVGQ
ncbi:hypothetical protein Y032_0211g2189 [Ancylostoma ceylanicum]|uniref:Uncharacterized protein n=1 Tax=Ancylostoma ceylanicum TaxID=53326 RepID=A0A016SJZ2_9BILA|nr:hypothetical protein Y032_0211g2189 [Ancylostoma ceylanicum]